MGLLSVYVVLVFLSAVREVLDSPHTPAFNADELFLPCNSSASIRGLLRYGRRVTSRVFLNNFGK